ncbi:MAG TPA: ABC transporter permease [Bryobacteraceae bacterium]|nr:ABC transporter permease [Bryobacteraceae bacterium]
MQTGSKWKRFRRRFSYWRNRGERQRRLWEEMEFHIESMAAEFVTHGMAETEARAAARRKFGNMTQESEEVRSIWIARWVNDLAQDLRYSFRSLRHSPAFTGATLLSLALGIGATTAIYSLVDQVILHSLPVHDPARLVLVDWKGDQVVGGFGSWNLMSYPMCRDLQQQTRFFDGVLCRAEIQVNLAAGGDPRPVAAEIVSGSYFSVLGVGPAMGRVIEEADDAAPGAGPVVVLAHDFWQAEFGGAADIVGRKVLINQHPMTVVGVAAAGFHGVDVGAVPAFWIPTSMYVEAFPGSGDVKDLLRRPTRWLQILARLRPGVTPARAQAGLEPWFKAWIEDNMRRPGFPTITADHRRIYLASTLRLTSAPQGHSSLRRNLSQPLWVLFAATGVLLGLACLNVAGLFLARGSARGREIGTRLALGASRSRIGRQLLADSLFLAFAGGVLGVAAAPLAIRALIAFLPRDGAATALRGTVSLQLLAFAFAASLAAGLLSGLAPALHAGSGSLTGSLRERAGTGFGGVRLRKIIVTVQVAFSLILIIGAGLFVRTLAGLLAKGPGFETSHILSFAVAPVQSGYSLPDAARLVRRLHEEVRALPATRDSAAARWAFLTGGSWNDPMTIQANRRIVTETVNLNSVTPGFFSTLGIRMLEGRDFDARDARPPGEYGHRSAIVNEAFVKRYLAGRDPIGIYIGEGDNPDVKTDIVIVGVCATFDYRGLRDDSEQAFFPMFAGDDAGATFYIKTRGSPEQAIASVRRIVRQADPRLPILWFRTLDDQVNRSLSTERLLAVLSGSFGALALMLSLIGLYGVMSFVVTRRTREIGVRLALGATRASAIRLVLRDAVAMIAAGIAIGLPCVAALGKLIQSQLFGVSATDPATVAGAAAVLALGALTAAFIPAWRAANVSPTDALRLD